MKILHMLITGDAGGVERLCVDISRISTDENYFYFFWGGGMCADEISKNGCICSIQSFQYRNFFAEYKKFYCFVKTNQIETLIIHIPSPVIMIYTIRILERMNLKVCLYLHADPNVIFDNLIKKLILNILNKKLCGTICISEFVSSEYWYNKNKKVIYNGTDINRFTIKEEYKKSGCIKLIYIGRIVKEKGVDDLIRVLHEIDLPYHLTIVGEGDYLQNLKELTESLNMNNAVFFAGAHNNIEKWLKNADLFVHPAVCKEGFGITLIEAMATGLPCIAYNRGAIPEIIHDEINGFLVNDFNVNALKNKLRKVMEMFYSDYATYTNISIQARKRAEFFNLECYVNSLSDFINSGGPK